MPMVASQGDDDAADYHDALRHRRHAALDALALITSALDAQQLARLRLLILDAGPHLADALDALARPHTRPAPL